MWKCLQLVDRLGIDSWPGILTPLEGTERYFIQEWRAYTFFFLEQLVGLENRVWHFADW